MKMSIALRACAASIPVLCAGWLAHCSSSSSSATSTEDAGAADTSMTADTGTSDASHVDSAAADTGTADADAGPTCILPDGGASGALDQSYGTGARSLTHGFGAADVAVDPQGRVYVVGVAGSDCAGAGSGSDLAVVRLDANGDLDGTFHSPASDPLCVSFGTVEHGYAVHIDASGNILIGGISGTAGLFSASVARITPAGVLDTTFNSTGKLSILTTPVGPGAGFVNVYALATSGNKIFAVGADNNDGGSPSKGYVARITAGGSLDAGFATGGIFTDTNVDGFWAAEDDGSGGLYLVGQTHAPRRIVVKHLDATGAIDATFGTAGTAQLDPPDGGPSASLGRSLVRMADGRLAAAGPGVNAGGAFGRGPGCVARLAKTGAIDTTFGTGGLTAYPSLVFDGFYMARALGALCDGSFFLAGRFDSVTNGQDIGLIRIGADGVAMPSFGTNGVGSLALAGDQIAVAAVQDPASKKIIVVGGTTVAGQIIAARFFP